MDKAADYKHVIVAWRNGSPVRPRRDRPRFMTASRNDKIATWFQRQRAAIVSGDLQAGPDANTVAVRRWRGWQNCRRCARADTAVRETSRVAMDRSVSIRQSVSDVEETLLIAIGLVIMVIFLFPALGIRNLHSGAGGADLASAARFAVMYAFDFSINNMTLLALTLSVGFVVDDAIVMLENIVRHIEHGHAGRMRRHSRGARENRLHHSFRSPSR